MQLWDHGLRLLEQLDRRCTCDGALAKELGLNPEDAYTIGILHAVGRVLINRVIEELGFAIYWDGLEPIQDWERSSVGFDYAESGAILLEHWLFPASTCDVIRWQLNREKAVQQVSLLGSLQFTQRLLALTGLNFEKKGWQLPETDRFVRRILSNVNREHDGCRFGD